MAWPLLVHLQLLLHPPQDSWSAFGLVSAWAEARGYTTARTSRPDTYRGANQVLRFALEGRLCLTLLPPGYSKEEFSEHPDTAMVREVLGRRLEGEEGEEDSGEEDSDSEEDNSDAKEESGGTTKTNNPFAALLEDSS